eukprot:6231598-Pyramimonas_sp.AAC.1
MFFHLRDAPASHLCLPAARIAAKTLRSVLLGLLVSLIDLLIGHAGDARGGVLQASVRCAVALVAHGHQRFLAAHHFPE